MVLETGHHLSALRRRQIGNDADGRLPVLLCMHRLRHEAAPEERRLLRVLLVRLGALPPDAGAEPRRDERRVMPRRLKRTREVRSAGKSRLFIWPLHALVLINTH